VDVVIGDPVVGALLIGRRLKREPAKTPKQRQSEEEAYHEQEQEQIKGHTILAA
jgi:hypothetical protein